MGKYLIMYPKHWLEGEDEYTRSIFKQSQLVSVVEMESATHGREVLSMIDEEFAKKVVASLNAYESISDEQP